MVDRRLFLSDEERKTMPSSIQIREFWASDELVDFS